MKIERFIKNRESESNDIIKSLQAIRDAIPSDDTAIDKICDKLNELANDIDDIIKEYTPYVAKKFYDDTKQFFNNDESFEMFCATFRDTNTFERNFNSLKSQLDKTDGLLYKHPHDTTDWNGLIKFMESE